jgi:hypothetical protein
MSSGERDLETLIRDMDFVLDPIEYIYASGSDPVLGVICTFREAEGVTSIVPRSDVDRLGIAFTYPCRRITLTVHSSLEAVGLLAAIATLLAKHGISVNAVSAYYHDHLFVRPEDAPRALELLAGV